MPVEYETFRDGGVTLPGANGDIDDQVRFGRSGPPRLLRHDPAAAPTGRGG